jgi:sulfate transport system permease protein
MPGFALTLGTTGIYLALIVLAPLAALVFKSTELGWDGFWSAISSSRAMATYRVTLGAALAATAFNTLFGLLLAWILVRYEFPGRRALDALVDLPFALPTAVAGIALANLFAPNGDLGAWLGARGMQVAFAPAGIAVAMAFTSLPFVVRTVQPVLANLGDEDEEAALTLGASDWRIVRKVIFPAILPALLAGATLGFARCLGEYGAIIFIAGNLPMRTEVTTLLTYIRLEEFDYPSAAALSVVVLFSALAMLCLTNAIQLWRYARQGRG